MKKIKTTQRLIPIVCLISCVIATLTACSNGTPRKTVNELPSNIEIATVNFLTGNWKLRLTHRQRSNRLKGILACQLETDGGLNLTFDSKALPDLSYQLTETIDITANTNRLPVTMPKQLNYQLTCQIASENYSTEKIKKNSVLYKIPGENAAYR